MKNFIANNWFKIILILVCFIAIYYFFVFIPKKELIRSEDAKQKELATYKIQFREYCEKRYVDLVKKEENSGSSQNKLNIPLIGLKCLNDSTLIGVDKLDYCKDGYGAYVPEEDWIANCINWRMADINGRTP